MLSGTGAHGAYHAGVLRALQEAGVKIDVVAGQGAGAAGAVLAAIDGGSRLWEAGGIWRSPKPGAFYAWTPAMRIVRWCVLAIVAVLAGSGIAIAGFGAPPTIWTGVAAAVVVPVLAIAATLARARWRPGARRAFGGAWWSVAGAPFDANPVIDAFSDAVWQLIRGAARDVRPPREAGRRYAEVLADNIGQPGFRELMIVATDLDARGDVVAALLREPYRRDFIAPRPGRERRAEALDLAGLGRDHALDVMSAALTPPIACEPRLVTFAPDGYWRGESHRLCERPAAVSRLFEELAGAGVSQLIVVTAVPMSSAPHQLRVPRLDMRSRLGEFITAAEAAALRDAMDHALLRFDAFYVIAPSHNPVGPFDFGGAYDEASDRRHSTLELMERAYEDAYHQFIEPVVGASGEQIAGVTGAAPR
ncbi:MAG TPA: patatin-like phospholipase family protein [Vicinamibacterales bacterium]